MKKNSIIFLTVAFFSAMLILTDTLERGRIWIQNMTRDTFCAIRDKWFEKMDGDSNSQCSMRRPSVPNLVYRFDCLLKCAGVIWINVIKVEFFCCIVIVYTLEFWAMVKSVILIVHFLACAANFLCGSLKVSAALKHAKSRDYQCFGLPFCAK